MIKCVCVCVWESSIEMTSWLCVQQYFSVFILPIYFFANLFNESVARFSRIFGKKRRTRFQIGNRILNADCNAHIHDTCQKCTFLCVRVCETGRSQASRICAWCRGFIQNTQFHFDRWLWQMSHFFAIYAFCVCAVFFRFTIFKLIILMYIKSLYSSYGNVHQKIGWFNRLIIVDHHLVLSSMCILTILSLSLSPALSSYKRFFFSPSQELCHPLHIIVYMTQRNFAVHKRLIMSHLHRATDYSLPATETNIEENTGKNQLATRTHKWQ